MKQKIMVALAFFALTVNAQQSFFEAIEINGEDAVYEGYTGITARGDGTLDFERGKPPVKITIERMPSGIAVGFDAKYTESNKTAFRETELSDYGRMDSYPYTMALKHTYTNDGYMMIDDLLFYIEDIPKNGLPDFKNVQTIYMVAKDRSKTEEETGKKKKKKGGFLAKMKAKLESSGATPGYKYLIGVNLEEKFNTYVAAMKAKQAKPASAKQKAEYASIKRTREKGDEEIKRYNDSIKATPEYQKILQNERNYQASKNKNGVTLRNNSGSTIYVGTSGSRNPGTKISSGGSATWNCNQDAYIQTISKSGGMSSYSSSTRRVYTANSGCGSTININ